MAVCALIPEWCLRLLKGCCRTSEPPTDPTVSIVQSLRAIETEGMLLLGRSHWLFGPHDTDWLPHLASRQKRPTPRTEFHIILTALNASRFWVSAPYFDGSYPTFHALVHGWTASWRKTAFLIGMSKRDWNWGVQNTRASTAVTSHTGTTKI